MIRGVIFDLDGVLVSTDELHYEAWKRLAEEIGIAAFGKADNEKQRGVSRMESLQIVLNKGNKSYTEEEKQGMAERKNNYYKEMLETLDDKAVLPGVLTTLRGLQDKKILMAVGSASKNAPSILKRIGLLPYLDGVSSGLDTTRSKPDPEVFLVAADKLGLSPDKCLVVEDSFAGVQAAKAAGMKSLGVGPYYKELQADYEVRSLESEIDWEKILG
ncbi:beta-phosphoglucomutase [Kineothrix sp. MB12-C1]|uniref:beta-phosphoglucomutase n=1 Tax=Kineothrix sp. MB12-C1 TaxID=3070215 RepID=UPI0027D2B5BF|nr:beta-phosphoglucomutase [Kineothrix sp. MB12-C1]WMC94224.1 beta-phosphoglucomutase [Kineothrix sp. MB12-C1]